MIHSSTLFDQRWNENVDFTREPIVETIITPKEGYRLVVRSSKGNGHDEFFVDAVEVVSFGSAAFFRSKENPRAFLVPISDYELLEVRETRLALKTKGHDRTIKIAGGRAPAQQREKRAPLAPPPIIKEESTTPLETDETSKTSGRRRERRRGRKRSDVREDTLETNEDEVSGEQRPEEQTPRGAGDQQDKEKVKVEQTPPKVELPPPAPNIELTAFLKPPSRLISETIKEYRVDERYREVFLTPVQPDLPLLTPPIGTSAEGQETVLSDSEGASQALSSTDDTVNISTTTFDEEPPLQLASEEIGKLDPNPTIFDSPPEILRERAESGEKSDETDKNADEAEKEAGSAKPEPHNSSS